MRVSLSNTGTCVFKRVHSALPIGVGCLLLFFIAPVANALDAFCGDHTGPYLDCPIYDDPGNVNLHRNTLRHVGNPIDVINGAKQQREVDFQAAGSALHLSRYYYSARSDTNLGMGAGWRHSYQVALVALDANHLRIQEASGRWIDFFLVESLFSLSDAANQSVYMANAVEDGYVVTGQKPIWYLPDGRELLFNGSVLVQIHYPNGSHLDLQYRRARLSRVRDSDGRELLFNYIAQQDQLPDFDRVEAGLHPGYLSNVVLPSGQSINYQYDRVGNLVQAVYSEQDKKYYRYDDIAYPNHLTQIEEDRNGISAKRLWHYDDEGRVKRFIAPETKKSLTIEYTRVFSDRGTAETLVNFAGGQQRKFLWREASADKPAQVVLVVSKDCHDCAERQSEPTAPIVQDPQSVLQAVRNKLIPVSDNKSVPVPAREIRLPGFDEDPVLLPIPDTLDSYIEVTIDGVTHRFRVRLNRLGKIIDIHVGNSSLAEMKDNWGQGLIDSCESRPLFERTLTLPKNDRSCFEDLVYLTELQLFIEDTSSRLTHPYQNKGLRSNANNTTPVCQFNPYDSCEELERSFELAQLSECAYSDSTPTCGPDWTAVPAQSLGLTDSQFTDDSFASRLFYNAQNDEYVLAFRGTDNLGDWRDNLGQATGRATKQYETSVTLAKQLHTVIPDGKLSFTGHSLGGGLATAAALSIESNATVFNPAALHPDTAKKLSLDYAKAQTLVDVTTVDGDLLTAIQEPIEGQLIPRRRAPGEHSMIAAPDEQWVRQRLDESPFFARIRSVILHGIDAVLESTETLLEVLCNITPVRA